MEVRITDRPVDVIKAITTLVEHAAEVRSAPGLLQRGALDGYPITTGTVPLQKKGNTDAVPSAFAEMPVTGSAFVSLPAVVTPSAV